MPAASIVAAFDAIARDYDTTFTETLIGQAQREAVWEVIDRVFRPGQRVLDINCGTGIDAVHMASQGVRVHACDASGAMVDVVRNRVAGAGVDVRVERRATEQLHNLKGRYHGVLSNFGGLNCVADLSRLACTLERLVAPGGSVVLCYMGPFCAWETAWYLLKGEPRKAVRRWRRRDVPARIGESDIFNIQYPSVRELRIAFAPDFQLREWKAIGLAVPPSYVEPFAAAHPRLLNMAVGVDKYIRALPIVRGMSDHVLLRFERVSA